MLINPNKGNKLYIINCENKEVSAKNALDIRRGNFSKERPRETGPALVPSPEIPLFRGRVSDMEIEHTD